MTEYKPITKRHARFMRDLADGVLSQLYDNGLAYRGALTNAGETALRFMTAGILKPKAEATPKPRRDAWGGIREDRPLFEHRHFVWLAGFCAHHMPDAKPRTLCGYGPDDGDREQRGIVEALARELSRTNDRFDYDRFIDAASGQPSGRMDYPDGRFRS